MTRRKPVRDTRTREQKIRSIVQVVAESGPKGVRRVGNETACRRLASKVKLPQHELQELMHEAVAESGNMFPGKRLLITAGRYPWYVVESTTAPEHLHKIAGRASTSGTTFRRHVNELDVELAALGQQALRDEGRALMSLLDGYVKRIREFAYAGGDEGGALV